MRRVLRSLGFAGVVLTAQAVAAADGNSPGFLGSLKGVFGGGESKSTEPAAPKSAKSRRGTDDSASQETSKSSRSASTTRGQRSMAAEAKAGVRPAAATAGTQPKRPVGSPGFSLSDDSMHVATTASSDGPLSQHAKKDPRLMQADRLRDMAERGEASPPAAPGASSWTSFFGSKSDRPAATPETSIDPAESAKLADAAPRRSLRDKPSPERSMKVSHTEPSRSDKAKEAKESSSDKGDRGTWSDKMKGWFSGGSK